MDVGERLRSIRQSKDISIYKLAKDSGVSESHIRNIENGIKHATVDTLELLVKSLNITMSEFFSTDAHIAYLTDDENILIGFYRTLPKAAAIYAAEFCKKIQEENAGQNT